MDFDNIHCKYHTLPLSYYTTFEKSIKVVTFLIAYLTYLSLLQYVIFIFDTDKNVLNYVLK